VFHLAAAGAYSWQRDRDLILRTNLFGTIALVEAAEACGAGAFVNAGTSSEYGWVDHAPGENETPRPNSDYAFSKAAATLFCGYFAATSALTITTLRLYSVYGAWEEPRRLVPTLLSAALRDRLPPLADPETARDFVFVEDTCDAFVSAANRSCGAAGAIYNVGSGRQTTLRELVDIVRGRLGVDATPEWGAYERRSWDTTCWIADPQRAATELGWRATTTLEDGLAATAEWLRSSPALARRYAAGA
jgi:nucleoside-diphosphate-sugar epimerase